MNRRVDVAYYIGHQPTVPGSPGIPLYNILLKNGIRNNRLGITHGYESTVSQQTLQANVPGIRFPDNPVVHKDRSGAPIFNSENLAYTII